MEQSKLNNDAEILRTHSIQLDIMEQYLIEENNWMEDVANQAKKLEMNNVRQHNQYRSWKVWLSYIYSKRS